MPKEELSDKGQVELNLNNDHILTSLQGFSLPLHYNLSRNKVKSTGTLTMTLKITSYDYIITEIRLNLHGLSP